MNAVKFRISVCGYQWGVIPPPRALLLSLVSLFLFSIPPFDVLNLICWVLATWSDWEEREIETLQKAIRWIDGRCNNIMRFQSCNWILYVYDGNATNWWTNADELVVPSLADRMMHIEIQPLLLFAILFSFFSLYVFFFLASSSLSWKILVLLNAKITTQQKNCRLYHSFIPFGHKPTSIGTRKKWQSSDHFYSIWLPLLAHYARHHHLIVICISFVAHFDWILFHWR